MNITVIQEPLRRVELTAAEVKQGQDELHTACRNAGCDSGPHAFAQIRFPIMWKILCGKAQ